MAEINTEPVHISLSLQEAHALGELLSWYDNLALSVAEQIDGPTPDVVYVTLELSPEPQLDPILLDLLDALA